MNKFQELTSIMAKSGLQCSSNSHAVYYLPTAAVPYRMYLHVCIQTASSNPKGHFSLRSLWQPPLERTFLCSVSSEPTAISRTEQSQWLQKSGMLDVPKLLDIAALYGDCNPELLRQLMVQVKLRPFFEIHSQGESRKTSAAKLGTTYIHGFGMFKDFSFCSPSQINQHCRHSGFSLGWILKWRKRFLSLLQI